MTEELTPNTLLKRDPDLVAAEMDGDLVMMSVHHGEYYGVGGVGPRIWELLEHPVSVEQITTTICSEFEVEPERCREDMNGFALQLLEMGLVKTIEVVAAE